MPPPSAEQYATWAHGLRRGDEEAFSSLYHHTYDALHRFVWYMTRDTSATADVLQELYLKLWQVRATVDPDRSLKALLYQMARNFALNHLRSHKRHTHDRLDLVEYQLADPGTTGQIMQFRVRPALSLDPTTPPPFLVLPAITPLAGGTTRSLALLEEWMDRRGYRQADIAKVFSENLLRVYRTVIG